MAKHRRTYEVPEPLIVRVREWLAKRVVCPIIGHRPVKKFAGIIPCRRHD